MNVFKIEKMDREQLLQICKIMNIKTSKKHTKAQLITKLLKPLGRKYMMNKKSQLFLTGALLGGLLLKALPNPKHSDVACAVAEDQPFYENSVKLSTDDFPTCDPTYYAFRYVGPTGRPDDGPRLYFKPSIKKGVSHEIKKGLYIETRCDDRSCEQTKKVPIKTDEQIKQDIKDAKQYLEDANDIINYEAAQNVVWGDLPK